MNPKETNDSRQLKLDFRVRVEPVLEKTVIGRSVEEVESLARAHYRWAKQLWVLHEVMQRDGVPCVPAPRRRVPPCSCPETN
jgi:hypothetical protein